MLTASCIFHQCSHIHNTKVSHSTHVYELVRPAQPLPYPPTPAPLPRILLVHPRLSQSPSLSCCMYPCKTVPTTCQSYNTLFIPKQSLQPPQSSIQHSGHRLSMGACCMADILRLSTRERYGIHAMISRVNRWSTSDRSQGRDIRPAFRREYPERTTQCHQISPP